jgi:hypothetical protein
LSGKELGMINITLGLRLCVRSIIVMMQMMAFSS